MNKPKISCIVLLSCIATAISSPAKTTFTTLVNFDGTNGAGPGYESLVQGTDGNLYGTTSIGGAYNAGTVFKITPAGVLTTLYNFCAQDECADGASPYAGLIQATDGSFYGTTAGGGAYNDGTVFKITTAGKLKTLHSFSGYPSDGRGPSTALVQVANGSFYGTTVSGGADNVGTVFRITPAGTLTVLYSFSVTGTDGGAPAAGLIQATNGDFYGTAQSGGAYNDGTVFKITPAGTLTTLYSFCVAPNCTDGSFPLGGLVQATNGDLYGTTEGGGANDDGTVFKVTLAGELTTLHSFDGADGFYPYAGLVQATDGNFYGTTSGDGVSNDGTVFKITPTGTLITLHRFVGSDGNTPWAGLVQATDGSFYGANIVGGSNDNCDIAYGAGCGTIFGLSMGLGPFVETQTTSGKVGSTVIILGNSLTGATAVTFNGTPATIEANYGSEITTTVPVGATTGPVEVTTRTGTLKSNVPFRVTK